MDDESKFWIDKTRWQEDAMGYVFLGNAVDRVGKFLFPGEWDGSETYTDAPYSFWRQIDGTVWRITPEEATPRQKMDIHRLLVRGRPEFGRDPEIKRGRFGPVVADFSHQEWNAGIDEAQRINAERQPKLNRKAEVRRFIKKAILDGTLRFVLLPQRGGSFSEPQDRAWWNRKDHDQIFVWCQMNPDSPLGIGVGGDGYQHVFVDGSDLDHITGATPLSGAGKGTPDLLSRKSLIDGFEAGQMSLAQEKFMDDVIQEGLHFWSDPGAWPRDTREYIFLGRVINQIGKKLFPDDWREDEMAEIFLPRFKEGKAPIVKPGSYTELYLSTVADTVEKRHGVKLAPLDGYLKYIAGDRLKSRERIAKTAEMLIDAVVHGDLVVFGQRIGGGTAFEEMPAIEWTSDEATDWLMFCHHGPYAHSPARLKRTVGARELPNFLFVQRSSLQRYMQRWEELGVFFQYLVRYPEEVHVESGAVSSTEDDVASAPSADNAALRTVEGGVRRKSKRTRVERFIERIFPDGIPEDVSDTQVYRLVANAMDEAALKDSRLEKAPSRETILRAAGRKSSVSKLGKLGNKGVA